MLQNRGSGLAAWSKMHKDVLAASHFEGDFGQHFILFPDFFMTEYASLSKYLSKNIQVVIQVVNNKWGRRRLLRWRGSSKSVGTKKKFMLLFCPPSNASNVRFVSIRLSLSLSRSLFLFSNILGLFSLLLVTKLTSHDILSSIWQAPVVQKRKRWVHPNAVKWKATGKWRLQICVCCGCTISGFGGCSL